MHCYLFLWSPNCTVSIIHMHYKCHFLAWSLMLLQQLSIPIFGCVQTFVLIKLQPPMFLKVTGTCPLFRPIARATSEDLPACKSAQACCWMSIRCPKKCLKDSDFFQHCESLLFSAVCFLKKLRFLAADDHMKLTKYVCDFFSFVSVIRWQQICAKWKQGTFQVGAKSRSY